MSGARYRTMLERIEANSMPIPFLGCWIWMGTTRRNKFGDAEYPAMSIRRKGGKRRGAVRKVGAHRVVIAEKMGVPLYRVKVGAHCCPVCETSLCVHPDHLRGTTYRVNNLMQKRYRDVESRVRWSGR